MDENFESYNSSNEEGYNGDIEELEEEFPDDDSLDGCSISNNNNSYQENKNLADAKFQDLNDYSSDDEVSIEIELSSLDFNSTEDGENNTDLLNQKRNEFLDTLESIDKTLQAMSNELSNDKKANKKMWTRVKGWGFLLAIVATAFGGIGAFAEVLNLLISLLEDDDSSSGKDKKDKHLAQLPTENKRVKSIYQRRAQETYDALPSFMQGWVNAFCDDWKKLTPNELWERLAKQAELHPVHLTVGDHVFLLQLCRMLEPMPASTNWVWTSKDKVGIIEVLVDAYQSGGTPQFYRTLKSVSFQGEALPKALACQCAQMALASTVTNKA